MKNEVAVVVGVGPGLGAALVKRFAEEGFTTVAVARRASSLTSLRGGDNLVILYDCDASVPEQVERLFQNIQSDHGALRVTVFNAGAFERRDVVDTDPADFERCWRLGCFAGFLVGRAAARAMLKHGQGTILFTGATASLRGSAGFVNLAAPKFALRALAQSMARELGPQGIHVAHVIIDGQIRSQRGPHLLAERGADSLLEPDAIVDAYLAIHRQQRSAWTLELDLRPWVEKF
ncbi:MAG: SDR family NAD(P)-dependent oxidoreductase [Gammaproteobacteria bacterium]